MKSSGPGGQHVNKTESACRITHIPTGTVAASQEDRSQQKNKETAMKTLVEKLKRNEEPQLSSEISQDRKDQIGSSDRSLKIRTYNFQQSRITGKVFESKSDHRMGINLHGIDKMMNGQYLDELIESFQRHQKNEKLNSLMKNLDTEKENNAD